MHPEAHETDGPPLPKRGGRLALLIGFPAAATLLAVLAHWEGYRPEAYRDPAGVPTVCWGDTGNVTPGMRLDRAECERRLEAQALVHAEPVLRCTPGLAHKRDQLVAAASLAYNIGGAAYCRSTVARRFNAGDERGACDAFLIWNRAGGRVMRGLVNRRRFERELCLRGVEGSGR